MRNPFDIYREDGLGGLLKATMEYLQWVVEYRFIAFVVHRIVLLRGGQVETGGLTMDVSASIVCPATTYRIVRGEYEREERELLDVHLRPDLPIIELGGGIGLTACHANRRLKSGVAHIVVEANPNLVQVIQRNAELNGCDLRVRHEAYDPEYDTVSFSVGEAFESGAVSRGDQHPNADGDRGRVSYTVPSVSLAELVDDYDLDAFTLIADIEGAEVALVTQETPLLATACRSIIMEVHPDEGGSTAVADRLREAGFILREKRDDVVVFESESATSPTAR